MYVEKQTAVEPLNRTLTQHPEKTHACHSGNTADDPAGTIRHAVSTMNGGGDSQLVLWDLSTLHDENYVPTWSNLVWNCDMGANEILQPIGHVSITKLKDAK